MEKPVKRNLSEVEKKKIGQRFLLAFKEACGIENKLKIAELLGYDSDKVIYKIANGKQELNFSILATFKEITGYSLHWLLTGEGEKYAKTAPRVVEKPIESDLEKAIRRIVREEMAAQATNVRGLEAVEMVEIEHRGRVNAG